MAKLSMTALRRSVVVALLGAGGLWLGEAAVLAKEPDKPAEPKKPATPSSRVSEQTRFINETLAAAWKANKLSPSRRIDDYEFIRRVTLDVIGRIAKPAEIEQYFKDPPGTRRAWLIERLLTQKDKEGRLDYARNWSHIWTTSLLTRTGQRVYRDKMQGWLEKQFAENVPYKELVEKLLTATGTSDANPAVLFILSHMGETIPPAERSEEGQFQMVPITARTTRLFLGYQIQCAQCHDHMFNPDWKQFHFWGINGFFRQVEAPRGAARIIQRRQNQSMTLELRDNDSFNEKGWVLYEQRNATRKATKPVFLDGGKVPADEKLSRREVLSRFIVNHDNFSKAFVNRLWGHFFGRGLGELPAADDFGEHNKIIHPELLDRLAKDFAGTGHYDPKYLIRWICNSDAYQLSCAVNKTNEKTEKFDPEPFFSRMLLKALSPEELFESLLVATQAEKSAKDRKELRERWMNSLIVNFGDDEGNEITFNGTVVQALLMMNGKEINDAVKDGGTLAAALKRPSPARALDELYLAALNRRPTARETSQVQAEIARLRSGKSKNSSPIALWQDILWALVNSSEFILNH